MCTIKTMRKQPKCCFKLGQCSCQCQDLCSLGGGTQDALAAEQAVKDAIHKLSTFSTWKPSYVGNPAELWQLETVVLALKDRIAPRRLAHILTWTRISLGSGVSESVLYYCASVYVSKVGKPWLATDAEALLKMAEWMVLLGACPALGRWWKKHESSSRMTRPLTLLKWSHLDFQLPTQPMQALLVQMGEPLPAEGRCTQQHASWCKWHGRHARRLWSALAVGGCF